MNAVVRRSQWRAARARLRAEARAHGRCIACLRRAVPEGRATCKPCGEGANAARKRRRLRLQSSAIEQARAFGIDLTLLAANLRLSPKERLAKVERDLRTARLLSEMATAARR